MSKPAGNAVTVHILDREYQVACPPEQRQALKDAAEQLDARMRAIRATGHVVGMERIAVMAALNLSYELQQAEQSRPAAAGVDLAPLIDKLDRTLEKLG